MAASVLAMKKELECSICLEAFKEPKVVGSCHHVFCKDCLRKYIDSKQTSGIFPCPGCRAEYAVPTNGVDGLKNDFRTANLVAILFNTDSSAVAKPRCSECDGKGGERNDGGNMAEFLCDTCDIDLCSGCRHDHSATLKFADHVIYDLCTTHWRKMKHYCRSCSVVICGVCMASWHSRGDHETIFYKDSFKENVTKFIDKTRKTLAEANIKHEAAAEGERALIAEAKSRMNTVSNSANVVVESSNSEISDTRSKIQEMEIKVTKLERRVGEVNARKDLFDRAEHKRVERNSKCVQTFKEVLSDLMKQLRKHLEQLEKLKATRCLGQVHSASIAVCKKEIRGLTANIKDTLKAEPNGGALAPIPNWDERCSVFAKAIQFKEWDYEGNGINRIFAIEILPNECAVATLGGTSADRSSFACYILYSPSMESKEVRIITDGVSPAQDMTLKDNGDLILLRREQPYVRFYQYVPGGSYDYLYSEYDDLRLSSAIGNPKSIAFDEARNLIIILHVKPDLGQKSEIMVIDGSNGCIMQRVGCSDSGRLSCDPLKQLIYKYYPGVESYNTYGLVGSTKWQVTGFGIFDINLGGDGQLFAIGKSESKKVMLHHIGRDKVIRSLGTLLNGKGQPVVSDLPCNPRSAIRGDILLVGVSTRVIFYRLV
jgi:flagellar hook-basal body complex protein FliE